MAYVSAHWLLANNGGQFTARYLQKVCRILEVENLFTNTYHSQCNGKVETFNRKILPGPRQYIYYHPKDWD